MPASLPGSTVAENLANPSAGKFVIMCPLSGPKGTPLDNDPTGKASTGAMCNGLGLQSQPVIRPIGGESSPEAIKRAGYDDDQTPGTQRPGAGTQNVVDSTMLYIGGGRMAGNGQTPGEAGTNPYTAGVAICGAGNGGSRDGTVSGFSMKMVTAVASIANGVVVETGWVNRSGETIASGDSVFGSSAAELGAAS